MWGEVAGVVIMSSVEKYGTLQREQINFTGTE
jgi:hypothetical protein